MVSFCSLKIDFHFQLFRLPGLFQQPGNFHFVTPPENKRLVTPPALTVLAVIRNVTIAKRVLIIKSLALFSWNKVEF